MHRPAHTADNGMPEHPDRVAGKQRKHLKEMPEGAEQRPQFAAEERGTEPSLTLLLPDNTKVAHLNHYPQQPGSPARKP